MKNFKGRIEELSEFSECWEQIKEGKTGCLYLSGHSGYGKTRLIQAYFYELRKKYDISSYWLSHLEDDGKAIDLTATLNVDEISNCDVPPWLWLATRCRKFSSDYSTQDLDLAFERIRRQVRQQLAGIIKQQEKRNLNKSLSKNIFALLANFALPGSGQIIELTNTLIEMSGGSVSLYDAFLSIKDKMQHNEVDETINDLLSDEMENLLSHTISLFNLMLSSRDKDDPVTPIIIVIDDAHWADRYTIEIIQSLLINGIENDWPLLVIMSSWKESIIQKNSIYENMDLFDFYTKCHELSQKEKLVFVDQNLQSLEETNLFELAHEALPNLTSEATEVLIERSGGDIDLLKDLIDQLKEVPGWLNTNGTLAVGAEDLHHLPSKGKEIAKLRLKSIEPDVRKALIWASSQGIQFNVLLIKELKEKWSININIEESIEKSDYNYALTKVNRHEVLSLKGEFRRKVFFEACRDLISQSPRSNEIYKDLLQSFLQLKNKIWESISSEERYEAKILYLRIADLIFNDLEDDELSLYVDFLESICLSTLLIGNLKTAVNQSEKLLKLNYSTQSNITAHVVLVRAAYSSGSIDEEKKLLDKWSKSPEKESYRFYQLYSQFQMRTSRTHKAIELAKKAKILSSSDNTDLDSLISLAYALWADGQINKAYNNLKLAESDYEDVLEKDEQRKNSFNHTCCLVLHDLEKNNQTAIYAKKCLKYYESKGDIYNQIITKVNLGDSLWALGNISEARQQLKSAYSQASEHNLPHALDISAICLANLLSNGSSEERRKAFKLYDEGIELAKKIEHNWDYLYGKIYKFTLTSEELDIIPKDDLLEITSLLKNNEYGYLDALASSAFLYISSLNKLADNKLPLISSDLPISNLYHIALDIHLSEKLSDDLVHNLLSALAKCEGIKLRRNFILEALNKVNLSSIHLSDIQIEFLNRWFSRFKSSDEKLNKDICLKNCDFKQCEARCCYDGVYLDKNEAEKIKKLVESNKDFFSHLPEDYIIESNWEDTVTGLKTNVRPFKYQSPDFPKHFNQTRCVFAYDNGACSLQDYSQKYTDNKWTFKPRSCVLHPLKLKNSEPHPPVGLGQKDQNDIGLKYPGYSSFTPCGQVRKSGKFWKEALKEELEYLAED